MKGRAFLGDPRRARSTARRAAQVRGLSSGAGAVAIAVGSAVLLGWLIDSALLKSVVPGLVTMKANTALAFALAGVALLLLGGRRPAPARRGAVAALGLGVALIGGLTLSQELLGVDLGIDQLLFRDSAGAAGAAIPGRMAPLSALDFVLLGAALALLAGERRGPAGVLELLTLAPAVTGLIALVGYLYGEEALYGPPVHSRMAVHTAALFLVVGVGALLARPERGLAAVVASDTAGGRMARRLLPASVVVPVVLGWLRLEGQRAGYYGLELGLALFAIANVVTFAALVSWNAIRLRRTDLERGRAEADRAALLEVARAIAGELDRQQILDRVQPLVAAAVPCDRVFTYCFVPESEAFRLAAHHGVPADLLALAQTAEARRGDPIVERAIAEGTTVVDASESLNPRLAGLFAASRTSSVAVAPLLVHGKLVGALIAARDASRAEEPFRAREVQLFESIASQLAVAMEAAELHRERQEEAAVSSALALVANELIAALRTPGLLERLCRVTAGALECESSRAYLWRPEEDAYVPLADHGSEPQQWETIRLLRLPREMLRESTERLQREAVIEWVTAEAPGGGLSALARQLGITRLLGIALRRGDELIGFLTAVRLGEGRPFSGVQHRIAQGIGRLASLARDHSLAIEELERANRVRSEFVATMSHELRTPLNVILGYGDLLLDAAFGPLEAEQADALLRMERSARELLEMINGVLDLSRLEGGAVPLDVADVSVAGLLAEIEAESGPVRERQEVAFGCVVDAHLPALETDRAKLKVVLTNLIGNALKFTEQGRVRVEARLLGTGIAIRVGDTGIGIEPEVLPVIFEPFRRGDSSSTCRYGGVGLGLHIVRRLLDALGGRIEVESAVGRGSTFEVWLPMRLAGRAAGAAGRRQDLAARPAA